jgi:lipoprotein-releasing system permease protein
MYKYLLCWRYLRTRYIALASIVSVLLGVATMIVVNSVMAGFAEKMRDRLHGVLADVIVESYDLDGFSDSDEVMARIMSVAGDQVEALAPTAETFGLMKFQFGGQSVTRQVQIIGIRPEERARTGDFAEFLIDGRREADGKTEHRIAPTFAVPEWISQNTAAGKLLKESPRGVTPEGDVFNKYFTKEVESQIDHGAIIGYALATIHRAGTMSDEFIAPPGTQIKLVFPRAGKRPEPGYDSFTVMGYFKSGMSEYDSSHVYVPLERLQEMRLLKDPQGRVAVKQIQVKVKLSATLQTALEQLRPMYFRVSTWEQKQGPLLSAVAIEQSILNMLLFFIIAVAGFGILAIFSMIVVEKTRDIGVMKALGASTAGVRGIFLGYGLLLGLVGSGIGMAGGLLFVHFINDIEKWLSKLTGRKVFDDTIYYFDKIPTRVDPWTVAWIVGGALLISAVACIWPAQRAAKLHPVRALRYE